MNTMNHRRTRIPSSPCPHCEVIHDAAGDVQADAEGRASPAPQPGDFTLCIKCAGVSRFARDMTLESIPKTEWESFCAEDPRTVAQLRKQQSVIRKMNRL